jgi:hypothetical protein
MSTTASSEKEVISQRAYQLWEATGYQHGHDQEHWQQAEHELRERQLKAEQADKRGRTVEPPLAGNHASAPAPHSTNNVRPHLKPVVPTEELHHPRHV